MENYWSNVKRRRLLSVLETEKRLLESHYDFLEVKIVRKNNGPRLVVNGFCDVLGKKYCYVVRYDGINAPKVFITSPTKVVHRHMYKDRSLCLYYPVDLKWSQHHHLYNTIIPWTQEWFWYYEIDIISGVWEHPEVKHPMRYKPQRA